MRIAFNPSTVAALITPPNNKDITFDLRGHNIFARGVKFCGTDTNTWRDIKINNVSIDSNILDLRDGDNTTLTNINGVVAINSTWRPVVDNLTSDSTTSSLSANQGRVLKALIDGKSDSEHTHDDRYLRLTGGWMQGDINFGGDNKIYWGRNTDSASISFKNDGDGDDDSYMSFVTSDNGNEYFRWSHSSGSTNTEWMALRSDGLRVGGTKVSLEGHSHNDLYYTKTEVNNRLNDKSDSGHNHDDRYVKKSGDTMLGALNFANNTWNKVGDDVYMGDHNIGGQLCIMGVNGTTGLSFHKYGDASIRKSITFDGNTLYMNGSCDYAALSNQTNLLAINTVPNKTTATSIGSWSPISGRYVFHQKWTDTSTGSDSADFGIYLDGNLTANMVLDGYYNSLLGFRVIGATGGFLKANGTIDNSTYLTSHQSLSNYYTKGEIDNQLGKYKLKSSIWVPETKVIRSNFRDFLNKENLHKQAPEELNLYRFFAQNDESNYSSKYNYPVVDSHAMVFSIDGNNSYIRSMNFDLRSNDIYVTSRVAGGEWRNWVKLLDSSNYSGILDSRYYTESEVNSLLDAKLNRQNLSYGTWNPRGYNLAADYSYNGGDLSISESEGKIHISVDGYFWQNEGQYRVLDTSDISSIRGSITIQQYLSNSDTNWYPLIWGGNDHRNTYTSTGGIYKSYDVLSWQTSSQTLYATNIQTENIKHLSIGGGIYWNPYVESTTDGSDSASITVVESGVAGGTTLVLSQMNDSNDTIQFQTNGSARLYHNSYPILTTQNTYVSNNKGYINGTEITQVNNANTVDGIDSSGFLRYYNSNTAPSNVDIVNTPSYVWTVSTTGGSVANATKPSGVDNAWGVIHLHTHIENYATQLGFGGTTNRMYMRNAYNTSTFGNWQALAFITDIPTSLKNPYALTISLNGTSQGPYDGSAAKNINITPSSIGAATSNHNHDGRYVYNYGGTQMDGASINKNALGMTTNSGITGDWWHILQAAWNGEYRWNSQIAFPTQNRNGMYYRSGLDDNTDWGSWVKLLDIGNSYVTGGKGVINGTTITQVDNATNANNASVASKVYGQVGDTGSHELVRCDMNNDQFRIIAGSNGNNNGWAEIATADDGNEPIYVRQYTGVFSSVRRTLTLLDESGNTTFPGSLSIGGQIIRGGYSALWIYGRDVALLRETIASGYHTLWSLKTTNGSWDFGEYTTSGLYNIPILSYITDSNYNSGNNVVTYQIKFPLASGTVALTSYGGDNSHPIFLGYLNLDHGSDGTVSSSFYCLGYSVPFTYTRGGNYCRISIPDTSYQVFYIRAAIASVNYSGGGMDTWTGYRRGAGAWWLHCYVSSLNEVRVKGFRQANDNNDSWWGGNPLVSDNSGANRITVCIFGNVTFR